MFMYVEMRKYMKKKLFSVLLVGALAASLVACGKTEKKEAKASTANTEIYRKHACSHWWMQRARRIPRQREGHPYRLGA